MVEKRVRIERDEEISRERLIGDGAGDTSNQSFLGPTEQVQRIEGNNSSPSGHGKPEWGVNRRATTRNAAISFNVDSSGLETQETVVSSEADSNILGPLGQLTPQSSFCIQDSTGTPDSLSTSKDRLQPQPSAWGCESESRTGSNAYNLKIEVC
jgi:hypothetical protein